MKKRLLWILELLAWLLILFTVSGVIMFAKYTHQKNFNTYQIFLPDVDGLINGSPVKLMGIQIGYVNQIDIVGEDVYVRFIVTAPDVRIPRGSTATVEFSGLGGSKSLELYPPVDDNSLGKLLIVQSPKRIHDSLGLLSEMFDKLIEITYTTSRFMDQVGIIKNMGKYNNKKEYNEVVVHKSPEDFLKFSNGWIEKAQKQCDKFNDKLKEIKKVKDEKNSGQNKSK